MRRGRRLVFCEVKEKTGAGFGDPLEMVDDEKARRSRLAAEAWLARNPDCLATSTSGFEVIAVRAGALERRPL